MVTNQDIKIFGKYYPVEVTTSRYITSNTRTIKIECQSFSSPLSLFTSYNVLVDGDAEVQHNLLSRFGRELEVLVKTKAERIETMTELLEVVFSAFIERKITNIIITENLLLEFTKLDLRNIFPLACQINYVHDSSFPPYATFNQTIRCFPLCNMFYFMRGRRQNLMILVNDYSVLQNPESLNQCSYNFFVNVFTI